MLYDREYVVVTMFAVMPLRPEPDPIYRRAVLRDWEDGLRRDTREDALNTFLQKISDLYAFYFGLWPLLIPPLVWPYRLKTPEERITSLLLVVFLLVAVAPLIMFLAHYAAPIAGLLYVRFLQTMSRLKAWRPFGKPLGAVVATAFMTLFVYQFALNMFILFRLGVEVSPFLALSRNSIANELAEMPGRQLVVAPCSRSPDSTTNGFGIVPTSTALKRYGPGRWAPIRIGN